MSNGSVPTVGVNLTWLDPGVVGGSEEYTIRLLRAVSDLDPREFRLRLYGRRALFRRYPDLIDRYGVAVMPGHAYGKGWRIVLENSWLATASSPDSVVHHAGGVVPLIRWQTPIVTVHDLQPLDLPDNFGPLKRLWLEAMLPHSVRAARLVICPSRFTADRLADRLGVPEHKLRIVYHGHAAPTVPVGAADEDHARGPRTDHDPAPEVHRGSGSGAGPVPSDGRPYVLLPAIAYRHKRHRDIIDALAPLDDVGLVMTGRPGPETDSLRAQVRRLGMEERVHMPGRVSEQELDELYRRALALVFPSEYEGFGNPALEAMANGCPALVSDSGSLPEVVADAGVVVPTGSVAAWRQAIVELRAKPELARDLAERGRRRASDFTPERAARQLVGVYRQALRLPLSPDET